MHIWYKYENNLEHVGDTADDIAAAIVAGNFFILNSSMGCPHVYGIGVLYLTHTHTHTHTGEHTHTPYMHL